MRSDMSPSCVALRGPIREALQPQDVEFGLHVSVSCVSTGQ